MLWYIKINKKYLFSGIYNNIYWLKSMKTPFFPYIGKMQSIWNECFNLILMESLFIGSSITNGHLETMFAVNKELCHGMAGIH